MKQYRIRETWNGFTLEWFYKGSVAPGGSFSTPDHWVFVEHFTKLEDAQKQRDLLLNPKIH